MLKACQPARLYTGWSRAYSSNRCFSVYSAVRRQLDESQQTLDREKIIMNPANVQLLSKSLHQQLFTEKLDSSNPTSIQIALAQEHLTLQSIMGKKADLQTPIELTLPSFRGNSIEEHFEAMGKEQCGSYLEKAKLLAEQTLPPKPTQWKKAHGWTMYKNGECMAVDHPLEDKLVFDIEVLMAEGHYPTMAVAASSEAWYSWASPYLTGDSPQKEQLISLGKEEKLIIGHNVGYDRARIAEEYSLTSSNLRFLDTMSLHIAVAGLCSQQRAAWNMEVKRRNAIDSEDMTSVAIGEEMQRADLAHAKFFDVSSLNSLKDVAKFYCKIQADKQPRSYFEVGTMEDVRDNFDHLISYCAQDVDMTHRIYQHVLPRFLVNCPHPVSFAGVLHMGNSFLTVNQKWDEYLHKSSQKHNELEDLLDKKLISLAEKARDLVDTPTEWQNDPWLCQLDWLVNARQRKLPGQPKWYKDAWDSKAGRVKFSIRSRIAPLLLRLKWKDYPLHYLTDNGWCYKVHLKEADTTMKEKAVHSDDTYYYLKVPHKDGEKSNCGNPLAKNYMNYFEEKILTSEYEAAREALDLNAKSAYWISSRERILNQFVVWEKNKLDMGFPQQEETDTPPIQYGMILPQMVTMGTVTRRAVEKTWLTASNAKANRIGSELKSMIQAPKGYKIVGADVDSEELWISSVIGDAQFGFHGATALGWMTLQGTKSEGTDLHSKTANILGISRDKAKIFNYARIYGAGVKYATSLLLQYSQGMTLETAEKRALALYSDTKGEKEHSVRHDFKRTFWHGGSESYMFNALEDIALSKEPRTPVLGCAVTDALKPQYTGTQFLTSRINWVVQSSGVDYLHMLIVSMAHLIKRYDIKARFMLSVHDEVRYLSTEEDQHRTALALQFANLWTRTMFSSRLGIHNLPQFYRVLDSSLLWMLTMFSAKSPT
ncbi:DNA polymerase family A-domain-containing protein [Spinellus fusiger]|nr:DNA polymerase family A-domain-containing protein [Spinellus fusiger]